MTMVLALALTQGVSAQDNTNIKDAYQRAFGIGSRYSWKMKNGDVNVHLKRGTHQFWYSLYDGKGQVYKLVDADKNTVEVLTENPEKPRQRPEWRGPQRHWMEVPDEKDGFRMSPDGKSQVYLKDNNLWVKLNGEERALTTNGDSTYYYSAWGSFSADGRYYATVRIKPAPKHYVYYVESSPKDRLEPVLHKQEYAKPGDSLNYRVPVIVEMATGRVIEPSTDLFKSQYQVTAPRWDADNEHVTFEFNERGHKTYRVLELSAKTGLVRTLIEEKNDKYINYNRQRRIDLQDGKRIVWTSERDGRNHIYLYDRQKGQLIRQVTKGEYYVRGIQHVDEKAGIIYFSACGMNKGEDPYLIHYYKIGLNGKGLVCLTPEEGNHSVTYTEDMVYLIDTYSTVTTPPVTVLRSGKDGKILRTLETADITALEAVGWKAPEVFVAKGRDGKTDMWGLIQRPSNFDPNKKYPIIEYIYSGPGDQYVPKTFTPWLYNLADLSELGFIVVTIDGMGTDNRSKSFQDVAWRNLKDAGFPDRILWMQAAAKKYKYMDLSKVGIYGYSAGGQNAMAALLFHPEFYKVGVALCGCHDNRMDKIWWNEQWMGYPVGPWYGESSNVDNAWRLEGKLFLINGEVDDNVDPASTLQVVSELIKHGKDFEQLYVPGYSHNLGADWITRRVFEFFWKNCR